LKEVKLAGSRDLGQTNRQNRRPVKHHGCAVLRELIPSNSDWQPAEARAPKRYRWTTSNAKIGSVFIRVNHS
jgi:hypothetical protein